jgi:hypothetical protein
MLFCRWQSHQAGKRAHESLRTASTVLLRSGISTLTTLAALPTGSVSCQLVNAR